MVQVEWTERAIARLEAVKDYISKTNPTSARQIIEAICQRTERLATFPRMGHEVSAPHDREIREIRYGNYRIFYEIKSEQLVEIMSVVHSSTNIRDYLDL